MGPETDNQTNILRKTPGLTNLFHSNVRRSRSLASLQREAAEQQPPPAMRSRTPLGAYNSFSESPQAQRPPLRPVRTTNSPEGHGAQPKQRWFANHSLNPSITRTPSPPSRPKPAPRLWTEYDDEPEIKPSLLGSQHIPQIMRQPPPGYPPNPPNSRSPSPLASMQSRHERSLSRRRKQSVADLNLDPLSTVTETSNESPSFPGRPRSIRNLSDPTSTPGHAGRESLTPRAQSTDDTARTPQPGDAQGAPAVTPAASKRASSMLLPIALAPLITSSPPECTNYNITSPEGVKPPVPPKDSIYAATPNKAPTPRPVQQGSQSTTSSASHSAQSSLSDLDYTVASSVTTMSPIDLPNTWPVELPTHEDACSPKSQQQDESEDASGKMPWVMKEYKAVPPRKPLGKMTPQPLPGSHSAETVPRLTVDNVAKLSVSADNVPTLSTPTPGSLHQRNTSDSVLNRGRPTKRGNQHRPQRTISRDLRLANIAGTIEDLPEGYNKMQALTTFSPEQLSSMRREADCDASGFDVLAPNDVQDLKKEQDLLDKHCNELRRRALSLRETRQQLHNRLLSFLKSPGNPVVSRDHVLKQDAEISELDRKIDDATNKLEAAQDRRVKVQRRLLEHVAAALALKVPGLTNSVAEEQTPPRSPINQPTSIVIAMESDDMQLSPSRERTPSAPTDVEADAEERAYAEWMQRERAEVERRESEERQEAERQQLELERELFRQAEEREKNSPKESAKKASPKNAKEASPKKASRDETSPTLVQLPERTSSRANHANEDSPATEPQQETLELLTRKRYEPPGATTDSATKESPNTESPKEQSPKESPHTPEPETPEPAAAAAGPEPKGTSSMFSPREDVQSIQVYADEDVYSAHQEGMDSLLSSIEQEIDAMDRQRATAVYA